MLSKLYSLKDYASVALHYTAVGALAAGAVVLGSPWALAIGAGVTMAIAPAMTKAASSFLENELKEQRTELLKNIKEGDIVEKVEQPVDDGQRAVDERAIGVIANAGTQIPRPGSLPRTSGTA